MAQSSSAQPALNPAVDEYLKVWAAKLGEVLTQIASAPCTMETVLTEPAAIPPPEEHDLHSLVTAGGSLQGEMSLRVPRSVVLAVGQLFLQESQDNAAAVTADHRDALQEWLRQAAGQICTTLGARWGEVQLRVEEKPAPTWSPAARGWLSSDPASPYRLLLEWQLSSSLTAALSSRQEKPPEPAVHRPAAPAPDRLDLLMDVELSLALRFGKRNILLREILDLDAGSVVALDRQVHEPADLLLAGRVIARGEVVVVDGNYGLRVLEIVAPTGIVDGR